MKRHLYPAAWEKISAFVRYSRARNRCEWCGARNHEPHPITGSRVVLTTAHVYDKDPGNCRLLNLAALCQRCHLEHDRKKPPADQLQIAMNRRLRKRVQKQLRRAIVRTRLAEAQLAFTQWAESLKKATGGDTHKDPKPGAPRR